MPYKYSKCGTSPVLRFIESPITVPEFSHLSDAESFLAKIATLMAAGELDFRSGLELSSIVKAWIDSQYQREELQFKINPPEERDQVIKIQGGLPVMPGLEGVVMPQLNGHATNGHDVLAPPVPQLESSGKESVSSPTNSGSPLAPNGAPETQGGEP